MNMLDIEPGYAPVSSTAYEKAIVQNLIVMIPEANEVQIDIDSEEAYQQYRQRLFIFSKHVSVVGIRETPSKSGGESRHVRLYLSDPLEPWQRVAIQSALGSDPMRELLSCVMLCNGDPRPTLMFETEESASAVDKGYGEVCAQQLELQEILGLL